MTIKILSWNVNGASNKWSSLYEILYSEFADVDIICLIETRCLLSQLNELTSFGEWIGIDASIKVLRYSGGIGILPKRNVEVNIVKSGKRFVTIEVKNFFLK